MLYAVQANCTAIDWLRYMGDPAVNSYVPFKFNWKLKPEADKKPLNESVVPCNAAADDRSFPCSCQDCAQSCGPDIPYPSHRPKAESCYFAGIDCFTFLAILIFSGTTLVIFVMTALQFLVSSDSLFK